MITILHNPRCGKSREGVALLEDSGKAFKVHNYLQHPLNESELTVLIQKLNIPPIAVVRQKEKIWVEQYKHKILSDVEIIKVIAEHPILLVRPIVINENKAIIGCPPKKIVDII